MKTEIDPRPITSFDDLLAFTEAELKELREPYERSWWDKLLAVLVWIPLLMVFFCLVWLACAAYWWSRYGDEVAEGALGLLYILLSGMYYS